MPRERNDRWGRWPARSSGEPRPARMARDSLEADAVIVDSGDGLVAELQLRNRTSRPARFWIGGEAVEIDHWAVVDGNGSAALVVPVSAGMIEVRTDGPTGAAIMVGEVPEPAWGSLEEETAHER